MIIPNIHYSLEIVNIGGGIAVSLLVIFTIISLITENGKYRNRYIFDTIDMCNNTLLLTFAIVIISKVLFII